MEIDLIKPIMGIENPTKVFFTQAINGKYSYPLMQID